MIFNYILVGILHHVYISHSRCCSCVITGPGVRSTGLEVFSREMSYLYVDMCRSTTTDLKKTKSTETRQVLGTVWKLLEEIVYFFFIVFAEGTFWGE